MVGGYLGIATVEFSDGTSAVITNGVSTWVTFYSYVTSRAIPTDTRKYYFGITGDVTEADSSVTLYAWEYSHTGDYTLGYTQSATPQVGDELTDIDGNSFNYWGTITSVADDYSSLSTGITFNRNPALDTTSSETITTDTRKQYIKVTE